MSTTYRRGYSQEKEKEHERFVILYRPPRGDDTSHHLILSRNVPDIKIDIATRPNGINVWMQGKGVKTLNGGETNGKYPIKWTLPGEVEDTRIVEIISRDIIATVDTYTDKNNEDLQERLQKGLEKILPYRGKMDDRGEIPKEFFEKADDIWLKRGLKRPRPEDNSERPNSGVSNWMLDIQTSIFFQNVKDPRDRLTSEYFEKIFLDVSRNKLFTKDAEREIRKQNQLQVHLDIKAGLEICFEKGVLKEKITSYKNWQQLLPYFENFLVSGIITSKKLSSLVAADKSTSKETKDTPIYMPVLARHSEQISAWPALHPEKAEIRDKFLELLTRWPKTLEMGKLLDTAFNVGIPMEILVEKNITNRGPMEELITLAQNARGRERSIRGLNPNYKPPEIVLTDKKLKLHADWVFVDYTNVASVGKQYRCCFSDSSHYETEIAKGRACAFFLPDRSSFPEKIGAFNEENEANKDWNHVGRGALAFVANHDDNWKVEQIRAFANRVAHPIYVQDAEKIVKKINEIHPQKYSEISYEIGEKSQIDPIQDYIDKKQHYARINQTIQHMDFRPETIDKMLGITELRHTQEDVLLNENAIKAER